MTKRNRVLVVGLVALVAATAVAFVVLAQTEGTVAATPSPRRALIERIAANLGVEADALVAAFATARLEMIDEAVAAGRITAEQALAMKDRIVARRALHDVFAQAIADGRITQDQLALMRQRDRGGFGGPGALRRGGRGGCERWLRSPGERGSGG
ncbi:TPA: hypothetical protein DCY67_04350 [Candidatus Acetothermia bacterium]|nr:hypothetical protein [Candidatus Acetothermia bacterium]